MWRSMGLCVALGCSGGPGGASIARSVPEPLIETADSTQTAVQTDTAESAPPCPLEGSWAISSVVCSNGSLSAPLDAVGTVEITGTQDECELIFDVVVNDVSSTNCPLIETVTLLSPFEGLWEGYSDGANHPECRNSELGPRSLGTVDVRIEQDKASLGIAESQDAYLQFVACTWAHTVSLVRQ